MEHFKPVFRHFFLEKFQDPEVWFERKLTYTRGVATSSIGDNAFLKMVSVSVSPNHW